MKNKSDNILKSKEFKSLVSALSRIESANEMALVLTDICTPMELEVMSDRLAVAPYLQQSYSYREIHALTGVSLTTIGRVAKAIQFGVGGYHLLLNKK